MDDSERASRGRRAASELRQTDEAFRMVANEMNRQLLASDDPDEILSLHAGLRALDKVRKVLTAVVHDGQMADAIIKSEFTKG